jgi:hypothetical protein
MVGRMSGETVRGDSPGRNVTPWSAVTTINASS